MKITYDKDGNERQLKTKEDLKSYLNAVINESEEYFDIVVFHKNEYYGKHSFLNISKNKEKIIEEIYSFIDIVAEDDGFEICLPNKTTEAMTIETFYGKEPQCLLDFKIINISQQEVVKI